VVDGPLWQVRAVHEKGRNRGREADFSDAVHKNGQNRGWQTTIAKEGSSKDRDKTIANR